VADRTDPDVSTWTRDWRRLQQQKWRLRGGVEARMITALGMYFGEQYIQQARDTILQRGLAKDEDKNKLSLVFNLMKKASKRKIGRLWSIDYGFRASPDKIDPKAFDQAIVVTKLTKALDKKLRERAQHWKRLFWLVNTGVAIEHTPWIEESGTEPIPAYDPETSELLWRDNANPDPDAVLPQSVVEQMVQAGNTPERFTVVEHLTTVGDVGCQILSGLNFFIDSSVPAISLLSPDQACYIVEAKTVGWVKDTFGAEKAHEIEASAGKDLGIVRTRLLDKGPSVASMNMRDLIPAIQGSQGPDDPDMCLFATRYQPAGKEHPHGRRSMFVPNGPKLEDGDTEYDEVPLVDFHYEAEATSFWSGDFLTDLIPAQKFLNKRMSQLGEMANAQIYETLLLGPGLDREDIPADMPGIVPDGLSDVGEPLVKAMQHASPPSFFVESIKLVIELFQQMGSSDLLDKAQFPGQLRGPMALPMIQEIIDSEDGPLYEHLGEALAVVKQMRVNRVKQFYPPIRTLHYTGTTRKDEVLVFHAEEVLRSGTDYSISVDPGTLLPEFSALREARIIERLSGPLAGLYTNKRTGRIDFSKIAMDLKYTDDATEDRTTQYRELAQHLIARLWQAEVLPPEIPYPFWDHDAMLDELESAMATTEFLEASADVKQNFMALYERHRQFLAAIQDAQMQAAQNQAVQGTIAQVAQQTAAKVASTATDAALEQIRAQQQMAQVQPRPEAAAQNLARRSLQSPPAAGVQ